MTAWKLENIATDQVATTEQVRLVEPNDPKTVALAASIRAHGIKQPLGGYRENGQVILVWGHRRLAAAILAQQAAVPVLIFEHAPTKAESLRAQLAENLNRVDLNAIEEAKGFQRLIEETGGTIGSIAQEFGSSEASVSKKLKLLSLPEAIQSLVRAGRLPESAGYELSLIDDPGEQLRLAHDVIEGRLSRDALRGQIKRSATKPLAGPIRRSARITFPLDRGATLSWSAAGTSIDLFIDQIQEILGKAKKARTKGWELDTFVRALRDQAKEAT